MQTNRLITNSSDYKILSVCTISLFRFQVFGGGNKPLLDANVQKIVDAGFSEEQAENVLRYTKNNVDRALRMLQKRDGSENNRKDKQQKDADQPKRKGRNKENNDEDGAPVKPSGKVSLFDFLEDKLPNVPNKDKNSRPASSNYNVEERPEKTPTNRDRFGAKNNTRPQGPRYDNNKRSENNPRHNFPHDNFNQPHNRDDRKYQPPSEKPPRFQRKLDEKKQQNQLHNSYNSYQNHNQYNRGDRQGYRNNPMDSLIDAASNLNLMPQQRAEEQQMRNYQQQHQYDQNYPKQYQNVQEMPPFRRNNDMPSMPKYPETHRRAQPNGYVDPQQSQMYQNYMSGNQGNYGGRQFGYGGRPQEYNAVRGGGPFLQGSLLGFQNAAVNEQARAMLGTADIQWKVGDRCLALYWEDNNVSLLFVSQCICQFG